MTDDLRKLRALLIDSLDNIIATCERRGEEFPSLDQPADNAEFHPNFIRNDPVVVGATETTIAAAFQLIATLRSPGSTLSSFGGAASLAASVGVIERANVAEIIRQYGPEGMHVNDIVEHNGMNADKLSRVLRHLAAHHVFKEVLPEVFAHNLISSFLDTGKDVQSLRTDPDAKYDDTNGIAAWTAVGSDVTLKVKAYLDEAMLDPEFAHSEEPNQTTFNKAYKTSDTYWEHWDRPENLRSRRAFNVAMKFLTATQPAAAVLQLYDWAALPTGAKVVDVGAGLGLVSLELATIRPDIVYVLEDRESVVNDARKYWETSAPTLTGAVHFVALDYLEPQPALAKDADVFLLRAVIHDLSDKYATKLLKNLRQAATANTRLIVIDNIVEYACTVPRDSDFLVPGYEPSTAPAPLLPNFGAAKVFQYNLDINMLNLFNAKERTIGAWKKLFAGTGWNFVRVSRHPTRKSCWPLLVAEPL